MHLCPLLPPNREAQKQVNPDPGEKNLSLLPKQSGRAPSHKRCPLFGPEETQACCIFIEHPLAWPFLSAETLQRRTFRDPVLVLSMGVVGVGRGCCSGFVKEKRMKTQRSEFCGLSFRGLHLFTRRQKEKSADGASRRILKPSVEAEFSGYPRQQERGGSKKHQIEFIATEYPLFPL